MSEERRIILAIIDVVNRRKTLLAAAIFHKVRAERIYYQTGILKYMEQPTVKSRFEAALKDFIYRRKTMEEAAERYGVDLGYLHLQIEYEHFSMSLTYFSFLDDVALLLRLKHTSDCKCQNCFKERIPKVAYEIAKERKISVGLAWERDKRAGFLWVKKFEETYKYEISKYPLICEKVLSPSQPSTSQDSRKRKVSFDVKNILNMEDHIAQKQRKIDTSEICDTDKTSASDAAAMKEAIIESLKEAEKEIREADSPELGDEFPSNIHDIFKTDDELLFLNCLEGLEPSYLTCRVCSIRLLPHLAHRFSRDRGGLSRLSEWKNKRIGLVLYKYFKNKQQNKNLTSSERTELFEMSMKRSLSFDDVSDKVNDDDKI